MSAPLKLTKEHLLSTTARLFAEQGYDGTSITHIINELGVARPTLYTHTQSKQDLLDAIYKQVADYYRQELPKKVIATDPPLVRLRGFIEVQLEAIPKLRDQLRVVLRHFDETVKRVPEIQEWWRELDNTLLEVIAEGQARQEISPAIDPVILKHAIWAVLNDLPIWYRPGRLSPEQITEQLLSLFRGGVTASNSVSQE
jgi:AcrR family transcriptional regulator